MKKAIVAMSGGVDSSVAAHLMQQAEYEVTGIRWQMGDGLTMEQRTQKAEEFIRTLKVGTPLILAAEPDNPKDWYIWTIRAVWDTSSMRVARR